MVVDDKDDEFDRWIRIMNKGHGYAGVFNYNNRDDKRIVEKSTIEEWRASMHSEFGVEVAPPEPNEEDPPDFYIWLSGKKLNVELVQMVEQRHKGRAVKGETPYAGKLFLDMQWSKYRFLSKLNEIITKKGEKYYKLGLTIDVLIIHTAETWLSSTHARAWLHNEIVAAHPSIRTVYLLFYYEPSTGKAHWPVMKVYGELFQHPSSSQLS